MKEPICNNIDVLQSTGVRFHMTRVSDVYIAMIEHGGYPMILAAAKCKLDDDTATVEIYDRAFGPGVGGILSSGTCRAAKIIEYIDSQMPSWVDEEVVSIRENAAYNRGLKNRKV